MAIILRGKTPCRICGEVLGNTDQVLGVPAFIADDSDSLWQYSDAAFHRSCFQDWDMRDEFVARFNTTMSSFPRADGKWMKLGDDGIISFIGAERSSMPSN